MTLPQFYPILDVETSRRRGLDVTAAAAEILEVGARILQFRYKQCFSRDILKDLAQVADLCRQAHALLVINDRADWARLTGAALHLGQDDLRPSDARRVLGADQVLGFSTHNAAQVRAAATEPVDYLAVGPIFNTGSKPNPGPVVGLDGLRRLRPLTNRPLVAIGGITRSNARSVLEAGADSVAVIADLFPEDKRIGLRVREFLAALSC